MTLNLFLLLYLLWEPNIYVDKEYNKIIYVI